VDFAVRLNLSVFVDEPTNSARLFGGARRRDKKNCSFAAELTPPLPRSQAIALF